MNHIELHHDLSDVFKRLKTGQLKPQLAKEIFNGAGKLINNCRNEIVGVQMGFDLEIPLLDIKKDECIRVRKGLNGEKIKKIKA